MMEDQNALQQANISNDPMRNPSTPGMLTNLLNVHHLLNSVEAALQQVAQESAQREALEKQGIQSVPGIQSIGENKQVEGGTSVDEQNLEPFKKKRRGGGRKRKSDDATVTIEGHTITATGDLTQDGVLEGVMQVPNATPKKNCLLCGAPIALRNYCWKCYKRKQRAASKGDMSPLGQNVSVEQAQVLSQGGELSMNLGVGSTPSMIPPFTFTAKFDEPVVQEPVKRMGRNRSFSDLPDADKKFRTIQEKFAEEAEKIGETKEDGNILLDEFARKRYKEMFLEGMDEPEVMTRIGKAFSDFIRTLPSSSPFKKPLLSSILKHGGDEVKFSDLEKSLNTSSQALQQAKKMSDEENILLVLKTLPNNLKEKLKKKVDSSPQDQVMMEQRMEEETLSSDGEGNGVSSLVQVAAEQQMLHMVPQELLHMVPQEHPTAPGMAGNVSSV